MKKCSKCHTDKELNNFYKNAKMNDGYYSHCKKCTNDRNINNRKIKMVSLEYKASVNKKQRDYANANPRKRTKEQNHERYLLRKEKYPEKIMAINRAQKIKSKKGFEKHHWSYNEIHMDDIIELTKYEHMTLHRYLKYDKPTKMYKSNTDELLDTKIKHIEFLNYVLSKEILKTA